MARVRGGGSRGRGSHEMQIMREDKMAMEQIDGEDWDIVMGGTGSNVEAEWAQSKNAKEDGVIDGRVVDDGLSNVVVAKDAIRVGDLVWVWGRYINDLWWPGQVYDPRDASELVLRYRQEGCVLVVLFGNGSCCWSLPSDLMPFVENLDRMVHSDSSKDFVNAVQKAVAEVSRNVESKNTCRCIPVEKTGCRLSRPVARYYAKEAGALIPQVEFDRLHIREDEPCGILAKVHGFARTASFDSVLELHVLKSWMSAYAYARRGGGLCVYSDPTVIEGMEDKSKSVNAPLHGPDEDDRSSANVSSAKTEIKVYKRREKKMKCVDHLLLVVKKEDET